jgi:hypothetical protein
MAGLLSASAGSLSGIPNEPYYVSVFVADKSGDTIDVGFEQGITSSSSLSQLRAAVHAVFKDGSLSGAGPSAFDFFHISDAALSRHAFNISAVTAYLTEERIKRLDEDAANLDESGVPSGARIVVVLPAATTDLQGQGRGSTGSCAGAPATAPLALSVTAPTAGSTAPGGSTIADADKRERRSAAAALAVGLLVRASGVNNSKTAAGCVKIYGGRASFWTSYRMLCGKPKSYYLPLTLMDPVFVIFAEALKEDPDGNDMQVAVLLQDALSVPYNDLDGPSILHVLSQLVPSYINALWEEANNGPDRGTLALHVGGRKLFIASLETKMMSGHPSRQNDARVMSLGPYYVGKAGKVDVLLCNRVILRSDPKVPVFLLDIHGGSILDVKGAAFLPLPW